MEEVKKTAINAHLFNIRYIIDVVDPVDQDRAILKELGTLYDFVKLESDNKEVEKDIIADAIANAVDLSANSLIHWLESEGIFNADDKSYRDKVWDILSDQIWRGILDELYIDDNTCKI